MAASHKDPSYFLLELHSNFNEIFFLCAFGEMLARARREFDIEPCLPMSFPRSVSSHDIK